MPEKMSKTQIKRNAYDYRRMYFKRNPGIRTGLKPPKDRMWFCSQCHRPLIGKRNVQVDHIWALGKGGINRTFNTVACCAKCNHKKAAKMGHYLVMGEISKLIEAPTQGAQRVVDACLSVITSPMRHKEFAKRVIVICLYALIITLILLRLRR